MTTAKNHCDKKNEENNGVVIEKARRAIFLNSCYGKQLVSALLLSKVLEERNLQQQCQQDFKKIMKQRQEEFQSKTQLLEVLEAHDVAEYERKLNNKETSEVNKLMHETKLQNITKARQTETQLAEEDAKLTKTLLEAEAQKKLFRNRHSAVPSKQTFKLVQTLQIQRERRYKEFIDKGIKTYEDRILEEDHNVVKQNLKKGVSLTAPSKETATKQTVRTDENQFVCHRQTLVTKPRTTQPMKTYDIRDVQLSPNFAQSKKHVEDLKMRQKETSPWSGLQGAHRQFAEHAAQTLRECR